MIHPLFNANYHDRPPVLLYLEPCTVYLKWVLIVRDLCTHRLLRDYYQRPRIDYRTALGRSIRGQMDRPESIGEERALYCGGFPSGAWLPTPCIKYSRLPFTHKTGWPSFVRSLSTQLYTLFSATSRLKNDVRRYVVHVSFVPYHRDYLHAAVSIYCTSTMESRQHRDRLSGALD